MFVFLCFTLFTFGAADTVLRYETCDPEPICQENEHYVQESATCQRTCLNNRQPDTAGACQPFTGCECDDGFVRLYDDATGPCVLKSECDYLKCNGDLNATYKQCPWACPSTCDAPDAISVCKKMCLRAGCECKPGYIRSENGGYCIQPEDCPGGDPCRGNQTFVACKAGCPTNYCPVDDRRAMIACSPPYPCPSGCVCKSNHLRLSNKDESCVLTSDCPKVKCTRPNEEWNPCTSNCLAESCSDIGNDNNNCKPYYCQPKCVCKEGFYRNRSDICIPAVGCLCQENEQYVQNSTVSQKTCGNRLVSGSLESCDPFTGCTCSEGFVRPYDNATGTCIPANECAPIPTSCGYNEEPTSCKAICPPQSCAIAYTEYMCPERQCEPGCNCIENHLRNSSEICILNDECPPPQPIEPECDINEEPTDCEEIWPNGTCDSICNPDTSKTSEDVCTPGCKCIENYLRDSLNICIPREQCQKLCPENEHYVQNSTECQNTCGNRLVRYVDECPLYTGYVCNDGYVRLYDNATGPCIPVTDCAPIPTSCGYNEEPTSCKANCPPQSCAIAYTEYMCPERQCEPGCNCIENHLRNSSEICILNDDCPPQQDSNPCGANGTLSDCSFRCPNQNCPEDDSRVTILCKPGRPCPPGCMCKQDYLRISSQDDTCVLARDCPKINCTRQNEIWDSCSSECLAEKCGDMYQPNPCDAADNPGCKPRCVCAKGHFRDEYDACVPDYECPNYITTPPPSTTTEPCPATDQNSDSSSESSSWSSSDSDCTEYRKPRRPQCIRTCAEPKPKNCKGAPKNYCKDGYILSKRGGKCIKIENCPKDIGCNGDKNAVVKACPLSCPPTCMNPNYNPCKRQCDPVGCECQPGYLLSKDNGKCILPDDCKGGNPCGPNATYVPCKSGCPTNYCPVDDRRGRIICETYPFSPCYPGCACQYNHKIKSREDPRCILSQECPKVNCTRPYEEWSSCPFACLAESCDDVDSQPSTCNTFVFNCDPKCICIKNHFRNSSDVCIPAKKCPRVTKTTVE